MKYLFTIFLFFVCSVCPAAMFPSHLKWRTLKSPHFNVIYAEPNKSLAEIYAAASEKALSELQPLFGESPSMPIPILLSDSTDLANGSATFLPYPLIISYPVLPDSSDSISYYENWVYELMIHELTHLFNMEPAHGFYRPFTYLFGTVVRPNAVLPRWYLEGLAVEVESRYTSHGRIRSPGTGAAIRAITLAGQWSKVTLDKINESSIPTWPYGQRPYLFGSLLWHNLTENYGTSLIAKLNQRFSRRVPFILNPPFVDETKQDLIKIWANMRLDLTNQSQKQIDQILQSGVMTETPFKSNKDQQALPTISPNGLHLVYLSSPKFESASLQLITRTSPDKSGFTAESTHHLTEVAGCTRLAWMPDSSGIVFDQISTYDRYYKYRDLYLLKINSDQATKSLETPVRLTYGARASEPAVSPSGHEIVFVRTRAGGTELALLNSANNKLRLLLKSRLGLRISQPIFRDERTVLFVGRDSQAKERIYSLDLKTLKRKPLPDFAPIISQLSQTPKGLLISANRTGVSNLYLLKTDASEPEALTNTTTEITQGEYDHVRQEIIYTRLTNEGSKIFSSAFKSYQLRPIKPLTAQQFKNETDPRPQTKLTRVQVEDESYSPWRYLIPRYWIPFVYPVEGGIIFQGSNQTLDPTGRHAYSLDGSYDSVTQQTSYGFQYKNATLPVDLGFTLAETNELLAAQGDRLTNRLYRIEASSYIPGLSNAWYSSLFVSQINSAIPTTTGSRPADRLGVGGEINYRSRDAAVVKAAWGESFFTLNHTSFIAGDDRLAYEKSSGMLGIRLQGPFPARHSLLFQVKGSTAPALGRNNIVALGDRTIGGNYLVSLINSNFLLRGYPSGALVGRTLINSNLEYRLPMTDIYKGSGTFPLFVRALEMAIFVDNALVDGAYLSQEDLRFYSSRTDDIFTGTGLEFTLGGTALYHLPLNLTLGLYYGLSDKAGGGFLPFLSIGYGDHGGVDKSSDTSTRLRPPSLAR